MPTLGHVHVCLSTCMHTTGEFLLVVRWRGARLARFPRRHAAMARPPAEEGRESEASAFARSMRLRFSPPRMVDAHGDIRQDYFRPTRVRVWNVADVHVQLQREDAKLTDAWETTQVVVVETKAWGSQERALLYDGIAKHGVGAWKDIRKECLQRWDETTLRNKTAKLVGCQNLQRYHGWKASKEEIKREHEKNRALGEKLGCWKNGYLVEDDRKSVASALAMEKKDEMPPTP